MPRTGYKTITVKAETAKKFWRALALEQKKDPRVDNSFFLDRLLGHH
ncbi:MAG: hypothetical protein KGI33_08915 [Thaumarchaeota archaeon]|nr:hypothetical protein [Nitrososphaerota archaeon]